MAEKMKKLQALKAYLQKPDNYTDGNPGREVSTKEFQGIPMSELHVLAAEAAKLLGVELE